jgi:hypothetical protein
MVVPARGRRLACHSKRNNVMSGIRLDPEFQKIKARCDECGHGLVACFGEITAVYGKSGATGLRASRDLCARISGLWSASDELSGVRRTVQGWSSDPRLSEQVRTNLREFNAAWVDAINFTGTHHWQGWQILRCVALKRDDSPWLGIVAGNLGESVASEIQGAAENLAEMLLGRESKGGDLGEAKPAAGRLGHRLPGLL